MKMPQGLWELTKGANFTLLVFGALVVLMLPAYQAGKMAGREECQATRSGGREGL